MIAPSRGRALARRAGAPLAGEFQVNSNTLSDLKWPAVAADVDGDFVVAWESEFRDGWSRGVFAQRFSVGVITPTATATATATATMTPTPTPTPPVTSRPMAPYGIPTLLVGAMGILAVVLMTACLAFLLRCNTGQR